MKNKTIIITSGANELVKQSIKKGSTEILKIGIIGVWISFLLYCILQKYMSKRRIHEMDI